MFPKAAFPATTSAASCAIPAFKAITFSSSSHDPITGFHIPVANIPAPPTRDIPRAPVFGRYSETKPIMVGQK